jgi:hypothetical protein
MRRTFVYCLGPGGFFASEICSTEAKVGVFVVAYSSKGAIFRWRLEA